MWNTECLYILVFCLLIKAVGFASSTLLNSGLKNVFIITVCNSFLVVYSPAAFRIWLNNFDIFINYGAFKLKGQKTLLISQQKSSMALVGQPILLHVVLNCNVYGVFWVNTGLEGLVGERVQEIQTSPKCFSLGEKEIFQSP